MRGGSRPTLVVALDGLIADTLAIRSQAVQGGLKAVGLEVEAPDVVLAMAGRTIGEAVRSAAERELAAEDETLIDIATMRAERLCSEAMRDTALVIEGALEWVSRAASRWRLVVRSDSNRTDASQILEIAGIEAYISFIRAGDDGIAQPSAPPSVIQSYQAIVERTGRYRRTGNGASILTTLEVAPWIEELSTEEVKVHAIRKLSEFTGSG